MSLYFCFVSGINAEIILFNLTRLWDRRFEPISSIKTAWLKDRRCCFFFFYSDVSLFCLDQCILDEVSSVYLLNNTLKATD